MIINKIDFKMIYKDKIILYTYIYPNHKPTNDYSSEMLYLRRRIGRYLPILSRPSAKEETESGDSFRQNCLYDKNQSYRENRRSTSAGRFTYPQYLLQTPLSNTRRYCIK